MIWNNVIEFVAFVGAAGLLAAIFNQGIDWFKDRKVRSQKSAYLGLRLAALLESYVNDSLNWHARLSDMINGNRISDQFSIGELEEFPDDPEGWSLLPKEIAGKVQNFRLNLIVKSRDLQYLMNHVDPHSIATDYRDACIEMSMDAWILAGEIREHFGLPAYGKVNAKDPNVRTGVFLENEANRIVQKNNALGIIEGADC